MTYSVETYAQLPEPEEISYDYRRLHQMRATRLKVTAHDVLRTRAVAVMVLGPYLRQDGSLSEKEIPAMVQLPTQIVGDIRLEALGDANQQAVLEAVDRVARAVRILAGDEGGDEL